MAYTAINNPELYFQVKTYTGDGSTPSITLGGNKDMQPDLVWIKNSDQTDSHCLFDSVRTATEVIHSDATTAETTDADTLTSFDSDGFALGADVKVNTNTEKYAAWCWKESATSGFDIVSYTGNATDDTDISHNLSAVPKMIIVKNRDTAATSWIVYHHRLSDSPEENGLYLNTGNPIIDTTTYWSDEAPTSSVFTLGTNNDVNDDTKNMIAYAWSEKQGFSKFGSWLGNGSTDGPFIYTGFRPAWILYKRTTDATEGWILQDNKISPINVSHIFLAPNGNGADSDTANANLDFLSNGFKLRHDDTRGNTSGITYIYAAFAEAPFVNSNGVPCNAR